MEKSRDLFKETRDTKGTFHAKMGSIKPASPYLVVESERCKLEQNSRERSCPNPKLSSQPQVHDVYPYQPLHAATSAFLLILSGGIPFKNSEFLFL